MVATRCPKFISATVRCIARVDFPVPPFSLPTTMTCAETVRRALTCINMPPTHSRAPIREGRTRFCCRYEIRDASPFLLLGRGRAHGTLAQRANAMDELAALAVPILDRSRQGDLAVF